MKAGDTVRRIGETREYKVKFLKSDHRGLWIQLFDGMNIDVFHCAKYFEVVNEGR